nr:MAG TPA: restriction alleviation protein [Caudoviricetes sp.]
MPFGSYINKIRVKRCPYCGIDRPRDWFIKERSACWKCRALKKDVREVEEIEREKQRNASSNHA